MTRARLLEAGTEASSMVARATREDGSPSRRSAFRRWMLGTPVALAAAAAAAFAAAGSLDSSFGTAGIVQIPLTQPGLPCAALVQADGRVVVAGRDEGSTALPWRWRVRRLQLDGTVDGSFGVGGQVVLFGDQSASDMLRDAALDASGRILVVGSRAGVATVVRLTADGGLDSTFGAGGIVTLSVPDAYRSTSGAYAVAVQPDGKVVVGGTVPLALKKTYQDARFAARLGSDGALDASFGVGGFRVQDLTKEDDRVMSMSLQSDGKIVLGGAYNGVLGYALTRLLANGAVDTAFGTRQTPFVANGIAVDAADRILVNGNAGTDAAIVRYRTNGTPDPSFGVNGLTTLHDPLYATNGNGSVAVRSDGRILLGTTVRLPASQNLVRPVRLLDNGLLDLTFGAGGLGDSIIAYAATPFGGLALAPDGGFYFAGVLHQEGVPFSGKWFVARYLAN